jgi:hypothetical protein
MSWSFIILISCAGFALGAALRLWRSPNTDPYANLARDGQNVDAKIVDIEESGAWFNIVVQYEVASTPYTRTLAWPSMNAKPALGATIELRYLPTNPGLSRLA